MAESEASKRDSVWSQFHSPILENATAVELEAGIFQEKARQVEIRKVRQSIEEMSMLLAEMQHMYQSSSSKDTDNDDMASISDEYISALDAVSPAPQAGTSPTRTAPEAAPAAEQPPLNTVPRNVPHIQTTPQRDSLRASLINSPQREAARRLTARSRVDSQEEQERERERERKHQHSRGHALTYAQQTRRPRTSDEAQAQAQAQSRSSSRRESDLAEVVRPRSENQHRPRAELRYEERPRSSSARRREPLREPVRDLVRDARELREPLREPREHIETRRVSSAQGIRDPRADHSEFRADPRDPRDSSKSRISSHNSDRQAILREDKHHHHHHHHRSSRRTEFSKQGLDEQLRSGELSIADLDLPASERKLLEKFITALSKLSIEVQMDEAKRHEGRRRMNIALSALEGWL